MTDAAPSERQALGDKLGAAEHCPHCGTLSTVEPSGKLRYRCRVCGGPRVVVEDRAGEPSKAEVRALQRAQRERLRIAAWGLGAAVLAGVGALALTVALVALWLATPGLLTSLITVGLTLAPLLLALHAWRRRQQHQTQRDAELDAAWSRAATDVLKQRAQELTAEELAEILHLDTSDTEKLLVLPAVQDTTRTRVTDAGQLVYSSSAAPRVRILETNGPQAPVAVEAESDLVEANGRVIAERLRDRGG